MVRKSGGRSHRPFIGTAQQDTGQVILVQPLHHEFERLPYVRAWERRIPEGGPRSRASGCAASAFSCVRQADEPKSQARLAAFQE
jgi:hypothetical protein